MTRDDAVDCATCLIEEILSCYYLLANLPSLNPSPAVNGLFEKLVHLCSQTLDETTSTKVCLHPSQLFLPLPVYSDTPQILTHPKIFEITPHLRRLCSEGEYLLEIDWAGKVLRYENQREGKTRPF